MYLWPRNLKHWCTGETLDTGNIDKISCEDLVGVGTMNVACTVKSPIFGGHRSLTVMICIVKIYFLWRSYKSYSYNSHAGWEVTKGQLQNRCVDGILS